LFDQTQAAHVAAFFMPAGARILPGRAPAPHRKKHMTITTEQPADLTKLIQARDGVAVVIYTKSECRQCDMTKGLLDRDEIYYTAVNVEEDETAYWYVTEHLGFRQMPVVEVSTIEGNVIWSGFQPLKVKEHITHRADAA